MGMYGQWARLSPDELRRAQSDLEWGQELVADFGSAEDAPLTRRRTFSTDKTWHALDFLLRRRGFPVGIVFGEQPMRAEPSIHWGYGPPGYLTPQQVILAASEMRPLTPEGLIGGTSQVELETENIYPGVWDEPDALFWAVHRLPEMKRWFAAAARDGNAVVCWIS